MKPLRILVLGSGGREHALAWRLARDPGVEVLLAPGNAYAATAFACLPAQESDPADVVVLARRERIDLVVVGPEAPLAAGVADALLAARVPVFGPTREAARLESSKWFAKEVMREAGVPTPGSIVCLNANEAMRALERWGAPYVVKADGLAAGKGVVVTERYDDALAFAGHCLASAGSVENRRVVIEEFVAGGEITVLAVCDGHRSVLLPAARDFKRAFDDDKGPNTGGMGAFAPVAEFDPTLEAEIQSSIVTPVLHVMAMRGLPYRGTLYCGLMLTADGPRVIEFNSRFGDPEAEAILPLVAGNLTDLLRGAAAGALDPACVARHEGAAVAVALVDEKYPGKSMGQATIENLEAAASRHDVTVFGAALAREGDAWRITGGRGAYVMAQDATLAAARRRAYDAIDTLGGHGWRARRDIAAAATGTHVTESSPARS